jgi:hypothetical protein
MTSATSTPATGAGGRHAEGHGRPRRLTPGGDLTADSTEQTANTPAYVAKRWLSVTGVLLLIVMVTAACSSSPHNSSSSSTPTTTSSASATPTENKALAEKYPGCAVHLHDGDTAKTMQMTNLRGIRYGEVSLLCGQAGASMYNTTGLNNKANPDDSAPALLWNSFSEATVAQDYNVPNAFKNGPRFWVNDWIKLPVGPELDFNGLNARWFAYPNYPPGVQKLGITANAYHSNDIARNSVMSFDAGKSVYVLVDPNNNAYVMQAASKQVNPNETIQSLNTLSSKLSLPGGWKYEVIPLKKALTINAVNGTAKVTTDDQGNTYDECFETACSYNPLTGK